MKKQVANLALETILRAATEATQKAAVDAVNAGLVVSGWKNGSVTQYGHGLLPLSQKSGENEAKEVLPVYEADDGPLTADDIERIRNAAEPMLPKGKVISTRSLRG